MRTLYLQNKEENRFEHKNLFAVTMLYNYTEYNVVKQIKNSSLRYLQIYHRFEREHCSVIFYIQSCLLWCRGCCVSNFGKNISHVELWLELDHPACLHCLYNSKHTFGPFVACTVFLCYKAYQIKDTHISSRLDCRASAYQAMVKSLVDLYIVQK